VRAGRIGFLVVIAFAAAVVQVVVVNALPLPAGRPDLIALIVIAVALASGSQRGAMFGFFAGFVADVMPPAAHIAGRDAFAYTIVGFLAGLLEQHEETSALTTIFMVAAGSAAAVLLYAALGGLIGDVRITPSATVHSLIAVVVYDVVLAPFVVRPIAAVMRRLEPVTVR
jgi:rod shape-determining protein MreD